MLAEFLQKIFDLTSKGQEIKTAVVNNGREYAVQTDAGVKIFPLHLPHPAPLMRVVNNVQDLVAGLADYQGIATSRRREYDIIEPEERRSTIIHCDSHVTAFLDDYTREAKLEMPLVHTPQFDAISVLDASFKIPALIRFLRVTLGGCDADKYVSVFRDIRFERKVAGGGSRGHVESSLGKDIEERVISGQTIPEQMTINVPVYDNVLLDDPQPIRVLITIDNEANQESIRLDVMPGDCELAIRKAQAKLRRVIEMALEEHEGLDSSTVTVLAAD